MSVTASLTVREEEKNYLSILKQEDIIQII